MPLRVPTHFNIHGIADGWTSREHLGWLLLGLPSLLWLFMTGVSFLGEVSLDQILSDREALNKRLREIIDLATEPWGIEVTSVELKSVDLPEQIQRAMGKQAEAEREKRSKIINSEGELAAAQQLLEAANMISQNPAALQMRYLQTLSDIAVEKNSTIVFPLPMDLLKALEKYANSDNPKS